MRSSDLRIEENYKEYLRLLQNNDYHDVTYDEESGGVSAVHYLHKFDKQKGALLFRRGDYERTVMNVLRKDGHRVVLEAEVNTPGVKSFDGYFDDMPLEIKAVEGVGKWAVCNKLREAEKQKAKCTVLYFPDETLYSPARVKEGIQLAETSPYDRDALQLSTVLVIVGDKQVDIIER